MKQITNYIWLGSYTDIKEALDKKMKVVYVGSVPTDEINRIFKHEEDIVVINLIDDAIKQKKKLKQITLDIPPFHKVLICCDCGLSRSPYVVAREIAYFLDVDMDYAYQILKIKYPEADENTPLRVND